MKIRSLLLLLVFTLTSCGMPKETQDAMSKSLKNELNESFMNDSIVLPSKISVELKDIQSNDENETGDYKASFMLSFRDFWDDSKYDVRGVAYFDSYGSVIKENGKKNIRINVISKNHNVVSSEELIKLRPKDTLGW